MTTTIDDRELARLREEAQNYRDTRRWIKIALAILVGLVLLIVAIIYIGKLVNPRLNLYRSNTEKQAVIKEQEAISEAEVFAAEKRVIAAAAEAEARIIEAQSIAEAQAIISETLTPEYLTWRFYEMLGETENQVIYVPTEAGLPVLEAVRSLPAPAAGGG